MCRIIVLIAIQQTNSLSSLRILDSYTRDDK